MPSVLTNILVSVLVSQTAAGSLSLPEDDASIKFGRSLDTVLKASCTGDAPSWKYLSPQSIDGSTLAGVLNQTVQEVTVTLHNVAPSCIYSAINEPCARHTTDHPALFFCQWVGANKVNDTMPAVAAAAQGSSVDGVRVGFEVKLKCPIPSMERVHVLSEYGFDGAEGRLRLVLSYFMPSGQPSSVPVAFAGVPQLDHVTFHSMLQPPEPPPPAPPPAPPMLPITPSPPPPLDSKLKVRMKDTSTAALFAANAGNSRFGGFVRGAAQPLNAGAYARGSYLHLLTDCNPGDYKCQAKDVCQQITGYNCNFQTYSCHSGGMGSYYPDSAPSEYGGGGSSRFNFDAAYDCADNSNCVGTACDSGQCKNDGTMYGNICACYPSPYSKLGQNWGLYYNNRHCGLGRFYRF